jgi:antitoxin PrlF
VEQVEKQECFCGPGTTACCRVEALVSIDERGQMVLPKELREKAGFHPGEKLAVTAWEKDGAICCITLTRVEELTDMVKAAIGPVMRDIL